MAIHQIDTPTDTTPNRSDPVSTCRAETRRWADSSATHKIGPGTIIKKAVGLTWATVAMTSPNTAGYFQPPFRIVRIVRIVNHPRAAHGSNINEVRLMYGSTYVDS